jgi:hypothetical protein
LSFIEGQISVYQFRLLNFYGDNMVLQSAPKAATIAGWGLGNTTVELDFNGKHYEAPVDGITEILKRKKYTFKIILEFL